MRYRFAFNFATGIICVAFLLALTFFTFYRRQDKRSGDKAFFALLITSLLVAIFHALTNWMRLPEVELYEPTLLFKTFEEISANFMFFFIFLYVIYSEDVLKKERTFALATAIILGVAVVVSCIFNHFYGFYFTISESTFLLHYTYFHLIPQLYGLIILSMSIFFILFSKKHNFREKIYLSIAYAFLIAMMILNVIIDDISIFIVGMAIFYMALFFFDYSQRGVYIAQQQKELSESQITLMISQIQPHFIYNCLSSISELITIDPKMAQEAITNFSQYLRGNFTHLRNAKIIQFNQEMEHVKTYLKLEKMRFDDRVNIIYDIKVSDFFIPALTLQPIVENAVKHGICKRVEGGTVIISTYEEGDDYVIEVKDDGVGFDKDAIGEDDKIHVGLINVNDRLHDMVDGRLEIESEVGKGADLKIYIPKKFTPKEEK